MQLKVVGRMIFELGGKGSSSPTGIRILAQGCRSETEATLGNPPPRIPNPNGVASLPESIPGVFLIPALAMLIRFPDKREKNSNEESRKSGKEALKSILPAFLIYSLSSNPISMDATTDCTEFTDEDARHSMTTG